MRLSKRITGLTDGGSDGWDIFRRGRRMIAQGIDVIELTVGQHDIGTDPAILDAMHASARGGNTGYASIPGIDPLRDAVARRLSERTGVPTTRDNIVICPGGQAALFAAHMAVCDPGDRALFIDPYYATYPGTIRATGAIAEAVTAHPERGFQPDPDDLARIAPEARSLLINSPNNPTGVVYSRETLSDIARVSGEADIWLISDEVYDTQYWSGTHVSPRQLPGMETRTLVIGSMSKSHAMTGSRIGWLAGPEEAIDAVIGLSTNTTYGVSGFIQDAAFFALEQGVEMEMEISEPFRRRHGAVRALLEAHGIAVVPSNATMYLMVDIRPTGLSGNAFAERLLDQHRIAVMPGESFGSAAAGHIRIALTIEDSRLTQAVEALAQFYRLQTEAAA